MPVQQLTTGGACHLEIALIKSGLKALPQDDFEFLFIENIGNLVCPASHDLAEHRRVVLISTTEGDDKPAKYPKMFRTSDAMLVTKTDLLPHVPFSMDAVISDATLVNDALMTLPIGHLTGEGIAQWCDWLGQTAQSISARQMFTMTTANESEATLVFRRVTIQGCVQGLGIRPTVARLARAHGLGGGVRNEMTGVVIELRGTECSLDAFVHQLRDRLPAGATASRMTGFVSDRNLGKSFQIEPSIDSGPTRTIVPLDRVVCEACLVEVRTLGNRRFAYPFTSCTDCGPRFSILRSMPFDRHRTSMSTFEMCELCRAEYEDPSDRRFHAQTNCCPACGPRLWSTDHRTQETQSAGKRCRLRLRHFETARLWRSRALADPVGL